MAADNRRTDTRREMVMKSATEFEDDLCLDPALRFRTFVTVTHRGETRRGGPSDGKRCRFLSTAFAPFFDKNPFHIRINSFKPSPGKTKGYGDSVTRLLRNLTHRNNPSNCPSLTQPPKLVNMAVSGLPGNTHNAPATDGQLGHSRLVTSAFACPGPTDPSTTNRRGPLRRSTAGTRRPGFRKNSRDHPPNGTAG